MIEITDGLFVAARHVAVVKKIDDESCAVFTVGQPAVDGGFLIDRPTLDVATEVCEELEEDRLREARCFNGEDDADDDDEPVTIDGKKD